MQTFKDSKLLPFVTALLGDAQFDGSPVLVIALHSTTRKRELYSYHGERIHYLAQTTGSLVGPPVDELMITSFPSKHALLSALASTGSPDTSDLSISFVTTEKPGSHG